MLAEPFALQQGKVAAPNTPGIGLAWDPDAVARYRV